MNEITDDTIITVCENCMMACCWHNELMCSEYKTSGTVDKTVKELKKINVEHPSIWQKQIDRRINFK